ncbi:MAG: hypothetical protein R3E56_22040 [Burkholderiaceae bacterium]
MSENTYIRHHLVKGPDDVAGWPTEWVYGLFISGYLLLVVASLIVTTATALLAVKGRVPGAWLALSGLALGWLFFLFQNFSGFMLGPLSSWAAVGVYGVCGLTSSLGFARMAMHWLGSTRKPEL